MQNKEIHAFLFDMDGVLIGSEVELVKHEERIAAFFEPEIMKQMEDRSAWVGKRIHAFWLWAKERGTSRTEEEYYAFMKEIGKDVYAHAPVSEGIIELFATLQSLGYKIGLVSASPEIWMEQALERMQLQDAFDVQVSLNTHPTLQSKPAPDGYLFAMEALGATPDTTIILEDSNPGIEAGKAAGALVIGYTGQLLHGYVQEGADMYLDTMEEVRRWVLFMGGAGREL